MEDRILKHLKQIYKTDNITVESRLLSGMSNYTYVIKVDNNLYTYRIPGKNAGNFVNRNEEEHILQLLKENGFALTNNVSFNDVDSGILVKEYVTGDVLSELEPINYIKQVALTIQSLHNQKTLPSHDYKKLKRLDDYENLLKDMNIKVSDRYYKYKAIYLVLHDFYEELPKVFSHGDFQPSNLILKDGSIFVVDFEFAAQNDPFYDIACFGNKDFNLSRLLLKEYLGRDYSVDEHIRLMTNRIFQTLQWHLVATYKHHIGLSDELKINFLAVSEMYLDKTQELLETINGLE